jgi:Cdc6-like AAA superfamily ATPase
MNMKNHYKEKFWDYDNDQLKDIIARRFKEASDDEVTAAIKLLKDRSNKNINAKSNLSLAQIPGVSMAVLLEIVKNKDTWGDDAVDIAEAEILRREHQPLEKISKEKKTILQIILTVLGVIVSVILIKLVAIVLFLGFLFYCVISCLDSM